MVPIRAPVNFNDIQEEQEDNKGRLCKEFRRSFKCKFTKNRMQYPKAHSIEEA